MRSLFLVVIVLWSARAEAWGCDGHRAIAILAEHYARPSAVAAAKALLAAQPMAPTPNQFCGPFPSDPIVEAATWADDFRQVQQNTGSWHFINFPLAVPDAPGQHELYCGSTGGGACVVEQIVRQYATAKTASDPAARARALRFLIHLIGDLHQPLHAIDNGDRGGNCVPVTFFAEAPTGDANGGFTPNLHGIWDVGLVTRLMQAIGAATPAALAAKLAPDASPQQVGAQMPTIAKVLEWAAQSNALGRSTVYGKLPNPVSVAPPSQAAIASCSDNTVGQRMLALNEKLGASYEAAARPVVSTQLQNAAKRLAATLDALFP
jgi:hypothetical protein